MSTNNNNNPTTFNGWTNYETWDINLWIDNDEGSQSYWADAAQSAWDNAEARGSLTRDDVAAIELSQQLKAEHEESMPDLGSTCWADLLGAALSEVNWDEIARNMIESVNKDETEED